MFQNAMPRGKTVNEQDSPYKVFNDYPIARGKRRSLCTGLAILSGSGSVEVAVEFKYESAHARGDIWPSKFPVVFWGDEGVGEDIKRIKSFVADKKAQVAYSLFIEREVTSAIESRTPGANG